MTHLLLLLSGLLFAAQFCVDKYYQTYKPDTQSSSVLYALSGKAAATAVFFVCTFVSGDALFGNIYTLLVGIVQAALNLIIILDGMRVLSEGSVAAYTITMMIGGMAVPAVFGICFLGDKITVIRIAAFVLIAAAVTLSVRGEKKKIRPVVLLLYTALFVCNGAIGIFTALHTNLWGVDIPYFTFMLAASSVAAAGYLPIFGIMNLRERKKLPLPPPSLPGNTAALFYRISPFAAGILNGAANLLIVIGTAASETGSAVTFPLVTGGTVLFTTVLARLFYKEKLCAGKCIGIAMIIAALTLFAIPF